MSSPTSSLLDELLVEEQKKFQSNTPAGKSALKTIEDIERITARHSTPSTQQQQQRSLERASFLKQHPGFKSAQKRADTIIIGQLCRQLELAKREGDQGRVNTLQDRIKAIASSLPSSSSSADDDERYHLQLVERLKQEQQKYKATTPAGQATIDAFAAVERITATNDDDDDEEDESLYVSTTARGKATAAAYKVLRLAKQASIAAKAGNLEEADRLRKLVREAASDKDFK